MTNLNIFNLTFLPRTANSAFFKFTYGVITINDILICLCQIPVTQLLLTPGRGQQYPVSEGPLLLNRKEFCTFWACAWMLVSQVSVVMVAVLSLSRLYILLFPNKQIKPWIALVVPGVFSLCSLLFTTIVFGTESGYPVFERTVAKCYISTLATPSAFRGLESLNRTINPKDIRDRASEIGTVLYTPPIVAFFLVAASFVASLILLKKSGKASVLIGSKAKQQREASKTVAIVTLIYIVCNIPFLGWVSHYIYSMLADANSTNEIESITVLKYLEFIYNSVLPANRFLRHYLILVIDVFTVSLNSALNPIVYFTRITHFRRNFRDLLRLHPVYPASITASTNFTNGGTRDA